MVQHIIPLLRCGLTTQCQSLMVTSQQKLPHGPKTARKETGQGVGEPWKEPVLPVQKQGALLAAPPESRGQSLISSPGNSLLLPLPCGTRKQHRFGMCICSTLHREQQPQDWRWSVVELPSLTALESPRGVCLSDRWLSN